MKIKLQENQKIFSLLKIWKDIDSECVTLVQFVTSHILRSFESIFNRVILQEDKAAGEREIGILLLLF